LVLALPSKTSSEERLTFRIQVSLGPEAIIFALSRELNDEHMEILNELLRAERRSILLDLADITLVRRTAVEFLARLEAAGVGIINCPEYVRTWIEAENNGERG
jgi:hypothetical protein